MSKSQAFYTGGPTEWPVKQTYLINLDRSPERLVDFKTSATSIDLAFERVKAVDRSEIVHRIGLHQTLAGIVDTRITVDVEQLKATGMVNEPHLMGELGCTLSHLKTILTAIDAVSEGKSKDGPVLVITFMILDSILQLRFLFMSDYGG